jgi:hypothetical protein
MSNVLIGIIGVILFIGLALAGALFLGPRFQDAQIDSKASAAVASVTQVAHSISLMTMNEGKPYRTGQSMLKGTSPDGPVDKGYLKSLPPGPINPIMAYFTVDRNWSAVDGGEAAYVVVVADSLDQAYNEKVCLRIVKQTGQDPNATIVPRQDTGGTANTGCFKATLNAVKGINSGNYYVFAKI